MNATGRLDVKSVITKKIDLEDMVEGGFKPLLQDKKQSKDPSTTLDLIT